MADVRFFTGGHGHILETYGSTVAIGTSTLDATGDRLAFVFQAKEAGAIDTLGFHIDTITGAPGDITIGLQGLGTTGNADGTWKQSGGNNCTATIAYGDMTAGTFFWKALSYSYTATRGEWLAIVLQIASGDVSNLYLIGSNCAMATYRNGFPYHEISSDSGGTWTKGSTNGPIFGYKIGSKVFGTPISSYAYAAFSSDSTYDEYGLRFLLNGAMGDKFKIAGVRGIFCSPPTGKTIRMRLATEDGTELATTDIDSDHFSTASSTIKTCEYYFNTETLPELSFGTAYIIAFEALNTSSNWGLHCLYMTEAADLGAYNGGAEFYRAKRADHTGAYTLTDTHIRPCMELIFSEWTEPTGSGPPSPYNIALTL